MVFKQILVALDHPPESDRVFEQALDLAETMGGQLMVFHGLHSEPEIYSGEFLGVGTIADLEMYHEAKRLQQDHLQRKIGHVRDWLQTYCRQAIAQGIAAQPEHRVGDPGLWICDVAQKWGADLIIMGRRGRTGLSEMLLGSVSNYVLHHAPCTVTVIQGKESDVSQIESPTHLSPPIATGLATG